MPQLSSVGSGGSLACASETCPLRTAYGIERWAQRSGLGLWPSSENGQVQGPNEFTCQTWWTLAGVFFLHTQYPIKHNSRGLLFGVVSAWNHLPDVHYTPTSRHQHHSPWSTPQPCYLPIGSLSHSNSFCWEVLPFGILEAHSPSCRACSNITLFMMPTLILLLKSVMHTHSHQLSGCHSPSSSVSILK